MKDNEISQCNFVVWFSIPFLLRAQKLSVVVEFLDKGIVNLLVLIVFH